MYLHGLRRDNQKWALAGGHAKPGESDHEAAERELKEETGLSGVKLDRAHDKVYGEAHVNLFSCDFPHGASLNPKEDPDEEFVTFKFLDPTSHENLHIPSERNILVDWMKNSLAKDQPVISFPKIPDLPTRLDQEMVGIPKGQKKDARRTKAIALRSYLSHIRHATGLKDLSDRFIQGTKKTISTIGSGAKAGVMMNAVHNDVPVYDAYKGLYSIDNSDRSTQHHEAAHLLMSHVEKTFGEAAKDKVIDHVLAHFHPEDRNAMATSLTGLKASYSKDPYFKEEMMNHFRDYLTDPTRRDNHEKRAMKAGYKFDQSRVKTAWKNAISYLRNNVDENWMKSPEADLNSIRMAATKLKPTEYSPAPEKLAAAVGKMKVEPFTADPETFNPRKHDFIVRAISRGKQVGMLAVTHTKDGIMPFNFEVNRLHRRKGYGTAMAAHAQKISGKKITRSPDMTADAVAFADKFIKPPVT